MTIKDFVEKKVAIAFKNAEQIKEFAKMCEGHNLVMSVDKTDAVEWMKDKPEILFDGLTLFPGLTFGNGKFVFFTYNFKEAGMPGGLSWNNNDELNDPHITEKGWKIIPFEEFKKPTNRKFRCVGYKTNEQNFTIGKVYEFEEVFGDEEPKNPEPAYKIEISYDGEKVTTARMVVNGKIVKEATARRNPEDKFDFKKGATLSFERLFK